MATTKLQKSFSTKMVWWSLVIAAIFAGYDLIHTVMVDSWDPLRVQRMLEIFSGPLLSQAGWLGYLMDLPMSVVSLIVCGVFLIFGRG